MTQVQNTRLVIDELRHSPDGRFHAVLRPEDARPVYAHVFGSDLVQAEKRAAFIIKSANSANSHQALVDALRGCLKARWDAHALNEMAGIRVLDEAEEKALAALALAESK